MSQDHVDHLIELLARDYFARLAAARTKYIDNPKTAGNQAQKEWIADIAARGGTRIKTNPRTGVDTGRGGQSQFDVLVNLAGLDVYLEVQAPGVDKGYKLVQAQGQLVGFAHVSAGAGVPARYYKIVGQTRRIYCWSSRGRAHGALTTADYEPQQTLYF